jgi:response regulator RpfG family c-di-GMP phosphodiesterase
MPLEKALGLVAEESGKMFDPMLAKLFIEMMQPDKVPQEA